MEINKTQKSNINTFKETKGGFINGNGKVMYMKGYHCEVDYINAM